MGMQAFVLGGVHMKGTSQRTGNDYEFVQLAVARRTEPGGPVAAAAGFEPDRFDATEGVLEQLRRDEHALPGWFELDGEPGRGGRFRVTSAVPLEA